MLGAIMFAGDIALEMLPNIHLVGVLTVAYTVVYRWRALFPIYLYVLISGLFAGFSFWWIPYLYIWTILFFAAMLIPRRMPMWLKCAVYPLITGIHGLSFGILYAPMQALFFGLDLEGMMAWIVAGSTFDIIHGVGNFCLGFLILPISELLFKLSGERRVK